MATTDQHEFKRALNLLDSTTIVIGSMIGSGIFIVSADIARTVGSPGWLLVTWVLTGVITLIAALSYGELAAMMPHAGGQYVYLRESYGSLVGFLYGWTFFLVIQSGTIAAVAIAFSKFSGVFFPGISSSNWILKVGTFGPYQMPFGSMGPYNVGLHTQNLLAIVSICLLDMGEHERDSRRKNCPKYFHLHKNGSPSRFDRPWIYYRKECCSDQCKPLEFLECINISVPKWTTFCPPACRCGAL